MYIFNSCCSGRWSRTFQNENIEPCPYVLILVVVDNGLVRVMSPYSMRSISRLNPCCSGQWSRTASHDIDDYDLFGLNPCCSGQWSRTKPRRRITKQLSQS